MGIRKMKYLICLMFCLIAIMLCFGIEYNSRISEIEKQTDIKIYKQNEIIEAQAKEIRLLKTDMEIFQKKYEREAEN